jgi:putative hydrolase of the HAD superfamily
MADPNSNNPDALVFDMDDTLYPESSYARSGLCAVASALHSILRVPNLEERLLNLYENGDRSRVYNRFLAEIGRSDDQGLLDRMIETHRNHRPEIELYPDADDALTAWRDRTRLGLISDGYLVAQRAKVAVLGLADRMDEVILTDEKGREFWKPSPWAFEEMALRLGVRPQDCVYVADNPSKDFVAPNRLGWRTVQLLRAGGIYADRAPAEGGRPGFTINSLAELPKVLAG